jgi:hypothetical protein
LIISNEDSVKSYQLSKEIENYLQNDKKYKDLSPFIQISLNNTTNKTCYELTISLIKDNISIKDYDVVFSELQKVPEINKYSFDRFYNYNSRFYNQNDENCIYDKFAIEFTDLAKVGEFKDYLALKKEIQIDMAQIEALKNYNFITNLTRIISIILIGFSILSVCMFVSNILKKHLEKIKMNIGTFKAFGIKNKTLEKIYLTIIFLFVSFSMIASIILSYIFGSLGGVRLFLFMLKSNLEENESYYQLFNLWTLVSVLCVIIISFIVLKRTAYKILSRTPGDLIYDRI